MNTATQTDDFSFEKYISLVDKYENFDCREINFQNRVIIPLLEYIFADRPSLDIVDVSTQYANKESSIHTRINYAGHYTPDLLIVNNWNYSNKALAKESYKAVVEIKSPALDPICTKNSHTENEVSDYLAHIDKVILTDCHIWKFFDKDNKPIEFVLKDENGWKACTSANTIEPKDSVWTKMLKFIKEEFIK